MLPEALKDDSADVRRSAAVILAKLGEKAKGAVPALAERVADDAWGSSDTAIHADNATGNTSKDAALAALRKLGTKKQAADALAKALDSKNDKVQAWATKRLAD